MRVARIPLVHPARRCCIPERPDRGARTGGPPHRGARTGILLPMAATAAMVLMACHTPAPVYVVQAEPEMVCVDEAPPEPKLEVPPPAPQESWEWQAGYWSWNSVGYDWVAGCWVEPRPGYAYFEPYYTYENGSWMYRPPYWAPLGWRARHGRHRWDHRGGHPGRTVAQGPGGHPALPAPEREPGSEGPTPHRAPPAGDVAEPSVHRAPPAKDPEKHRAPPAPDLQDPDAADADAATAAHEAAEPVLRAPIESRPPRTIRIGPQLDADSRVDVEQLEAEPEAVRDRPVDSFRDSPHYRGTRAGRPVFGDDPDDPDARRPPQFDTDHTGAIVLGRDPDRGGRSRRGGSIIIHRGGDDPDVAPAVERRPRPFTEVDPGRVKRPEGADGWRHRPLSPRWSGPPARPTGPRFAPPPRRQPAFHARREMPAMRPAVHRPAPVFRQPAPARPAMRPQPMHRPAPRHVSPAPAHRPAPAPARASGGRGHGRRR